jgi:hypothetical protein
MPKVEMDDTSPVHLGDRSLEFDQEIRRESSGQRAGEQNAGSVLEDQGCRVELPKKAWDRLDAFETPICPGLAPQEPGTQPLPHKLRPRRKILDHDRARLGLDEQNVGIAPTTAIQNSAGLFREIASVEPSGVGKSRDQLNVPLLRSQKMSTPKSRAISVPSSLLSSYRANAQRLCGPTTGSPCHVRRLGQSAGTSFR